MGRVERKVAFITGAARGMGRSHALRLAKEGADIIAMDLAGPVKTVSYPPATRAELEDTARGVEEFGRRVYTYRADVRDYDALKGGLDVGVAEMGGLDVAVANAGILNDVKMTWELDEDNWQTMLDVNLTGVWHTAKAAVPHLLDRGPGGSLILISSVCGLTGCPGLAHYTAAKHGVTGLTKVLANELGTRRIRVNCVHPSNTRTGMIDNPGAAEFYRPDLESPTWDDACESMKKMHIFDVPYLEPEDLSNIVLFLASDESRYMTGASVAMDLGMLEKYAG